MSISILNRGASGGLKPELTVIAPSGSTIDILQNGIVVSTYTLGASETEHTFVVKVGTYTVRGTLGTDTAEVEAVIDTVGQYEVTIDYKLWLYREGDECTGITGGWNETNFYQADSNRVQLSKNADNMAVNIPVWNTSGGWRKRGFATGNKFDLSKYSTLYVEVSSVNVSVANGRAFGLVCPATSLSDTLYGAWLEHTVGDGINIQELKTYSTDISSITDECHIVFFGAKGDGNYGCSASASAIWLE